MLKQVLKVARTIKIGFYYLCVENVLFAKVIFALLLSLRLEKVFSLERVLIQIRALHPKIVDAPQEAVYLFTMGFVSGEDLEFPRKDYIQAIILGNGVWSLVVGDKKFAKVLLPSVKYRSVIQGELGKIGEVALYTDGFICPEAMRELGVKPLGAEMVMIYINRRTGTLTLANHYVFIPRSDFKNKRI